MGSSLSYDRLVAIIEAQNEIAGADLDDHEVISLVVAKTRALTAADAAIVELWEVDRGEAGDGSAAREEAVDRGRDSLEVGAQRPELRVPLAYQGRVLGALNAYARSPDGFDDQDEAIVRLLAGLVAPRLAHSRDRGPHPPPSTLDALTGLPNHRAFELRLGAEVARVRRHGGHLALCLVDVDDFREVNHTLGRVVGDEILRGVARNLSQVRGEDEAFRFGSDEFAMIFSGVDASGAIAAANRLAAGVMADRGCGGVTITWGVAELDGGDPAAMVEAAGDALQRAKRAGSV